MTELEWGLSEALDGPDVDAIGAGLHAYNIATGGIGGARGMCCSVRAPSRELIGGAVGRSWGECAELRMLWVADGWRRRGLGGELLARVEVEAATRGCRKLYLDTFSFQAPAFYTGRGFETLLIVAGFPGGATKHVMCKALAAPTRIGQDRGAG